MIHLGRNYCLMGRPFIIKSMEVILPGMDLDNSLMILLGIMLYLFQIKINYKSKMKNEGKVCLLKRILLIVVEKVSGLKIIRQGKFL